MALFTRAIVPGRTFGSSRKTARKVFMERSSASAQIRTSLRPNFFFRSCSFAPAFSMSGTIGNTYTDCNSNTNFGVFHG